MYKELIVSPRHQGKPSKYAKIPVAFVATKLDQTDFVRSDDQGVKRAVAIYDVQTWLQSVHKRAENASFEVSARQNIGVSMMIEWIVKGALRNYQVVERSKYKKCARFSDKSPIQALADVQQLIGDDGVQTEVNERFERKKREHKNKQWQKYVR